MTEIILPELGEGISSAVVACWHVKAGQSIRPGDEVVEVVTDKASFCIEAPAGGTLCSISVLPGAEAKVGAILGVID